MSLIIPYRKNPHDPKDPSVGFRWQGYTFDSYYDAADFSRRAEVLSQQELDDLYFSGKAAGSTFLDSIKDRVEEGELPRVFDPDVQGNLPADYARYREFLDCQVKYLFKRENGDIKEMDVLHLLLNIVEENPLASEMPNILMNLFEGVRDGSFHGKADKFGFTMFIDFVARFFNLIGYTNEVEFIERNRGLICSKPVMTPVAEQVMGVEKKNTDLLSWPPQAQIGRSSYDEVAKAFSGFDHLYQSAIKSGKKSVFPAENLANIHKEIKEEILPHISFGWQHRTRQAILQRLVRSIKFPKGKESLDIIAFLDAPPEETTIDKLTNEELTQRITDGLNSVPSLPTRGSFDSAYEALNEYAKRFKYDLIYTYYSCLFRDQLREKVKELVKRVSCFDRNDTSTRQFFNLMSFIDKDNSEFYLAFLRKSRTPQEKHNRIVAKEICAEIAKVNKCFEESGVWGKPYLYTPEKIDRINEFLENVVLPHWAEEKKERFFSWLFRVLSVGTEFPNCDEFERLSSLLMKYKHVNSVRRSFLIRPLYDQKAIPSNFKPTIDDIDVFLSYVHKRREELKDPHFKAALDDEDVRKIYNGLKNDVFPYISEYSLPWFKKKVYKELLSVYDIEKSPGSGALVLFEFLSDGKKHLPELVNHDWSPSTDSVDLLKLEGDKFLDNLVTQTVEYGRRHEGVVENHPVLSKLVHRQF